MQAIKADAIGGFNSFLDEQLKVPGSASVTVVLFDNEYEVPVKNVDLKKVEHLNEHTFVPRGGTALLDAIGKTINEVGERLAKTNESEKPEKVLVCILTDGEENSSHEFDKCKIKNMIEHQQLIYNWGFVFLGANQDSFAQASSLGIEKNMVANFEPTPVGTRRANAQMSSMVMSARPRFEPDPEPRKVPKTRKKT